jgi:hypothetical protein
MRNNLILGWISSTMFFGTIPGAQSTCLFQSSYDVINILIAYTSSK